MRVDFWCSRPPYIEHAAPVWNALPKRARGQFMVPKRLISFAGKHGVDAVLANQERSPNPLVILSRAELPSIPKLRRLIFIEHGVGATYNNKSHLPWQKDIELILTTPANAPGHIALFGESIVKIIGCPKMDEFIKRGKQRKPNTRAKPTIAISHHWNQVAYPETRSAWPWDRAAWESIAASGKYHILGHKHPGDPRPVDKWFGQIGADYTDSFYDVIEQADIYVADNSSTLYEFAGTDRPVVVLSPPFYRRDVDHGFRFWSHIPGVECSQLDHLEACIEEALLDTPARQQVRKAAVEAAYGPLDGKASKRAVDAITALPETSPAPPEPRGKSPFGKFVTLKRSGKYDGKEYRVGDTVPIALAHEMKAAGFLTDPRL